MGYNMSDPNAPWLEEDPEYNNVLAKGDKIIEEMQTTREDPPKELLTLGSYAKEEDEVPRVPIDVKNEEETMRCSLVGSAFDLDLNEQGMTVEDNIASCQARCAKLVGCAHFSYLPPKRICRVHGVLASRISGTGTGTKMWISGPPGCRVGQVSAATQSIISHKDTCFHPHAVYTDMVASPEDVGSAYHCQLRCQETSGCAHFIYSEVDGSCKFAKAEAKKLQPVMYSIAGPRHCGDAVNYLAAIGKFEVSKKDSPVLARASGSLTAPLALTGVAGFLVLLAATFALKRGFGGEPA